MKPFNHVFTLNPTDNDGEQVFLHTRFEVNGDAARDLQPMVFATQELVMNSYCSSTHFNMGFLFNPTTLRKLADQLEAAEAKALTSIKK